MPYNEDFYKLYKKYLKEKTVRVIHDKMFSIFYGLDDDFCTVLDLGCGKFHEFSGHSYEDGQRPTYIGFDINESEKKKPKNEEDLEEFFGHYSFKLDYRDENFVNSAKEILNRICKPNTWDHNCFVSLFSTEITAPPEENQKLYERIFKEIPTIQYGLVSGFYYSSKKSVNPIEEAGEIVSWQTLDNIEDRKSDVYSEMRMYVPCPSKMFGKDVIEVWRFLSRE